MKRTLMLISAVLMLTGCAGTLSTTTNTEGGTTPATTAPTPKPSGLGVLTERTFGNLVAKIEAPQIAGDNYTGVVITLTDRENKPVTGATITATSSMPEHQMDGPDFTDELKAPGKYWLGGEMMKGKWWLNLSVKSPDGKSYTDTAEFVLP